MTPVDVHAVAYSLEGVEGNSYGKKDGKQARHGRICGNTKDAQEVGHGGDEEAEVLKDCKDGQIDKDSYGKDRLSMSIGIKLPNGAAKEVVAE